MKNLNDVRGLVFDEIDKLRKGQTTTKNLNAIVGALNFVVNTVKLELEYAKTMNKNPEMQFFDVNFDTGPAKQISE